MINRKKPYQKNLRISEEDRERAKFLREAEELGLTDSDIYGKGLSAYETELETIRRGMDSKPKKKVTPAVPEEYLESMRAYRHDEASKPFRTTFQRELDAIAGRRVEAVDELGFEKFPKLKQPGEPHALDNVYEQSQSTGGPPSDGLLAFYTLTIENWYELMESERIVLRSKYREAQLIYGR